MLAIKQWLTSLGLSKAGLTGSLRRLVGLHRKGLLAGILMLIGLAGFFGFFSDNKDRIAVAAALRDPLSVFEDRSPGARLGGALLQTKQRAASNRRARPAPAAAVPPPAERVLAMTRARPPVSPAVGPLGEAAPDLALLGLPGNLPEVGSVPVLGGAPGFDVPPFSFGDAPLAVAPLNPGQPGTPGPESPGSAVPEPQTWLMLLLGVGLVGHALRRQRAVGSAIAHP